MKDIQERSFNFACRIVALHDHLSTLRGAPQALRHQVLRSGTSIAANLEEANAAQSKRDFVCKCSIAAKEARETHYWLRLLAAATAVSSKRLEPLIIEANELVAILTTIIRNAQRSRPKG